MTLYLFPNRNPAYKNMLMDLKMLTMADDFNLLKTKTCAFSKKFRLENSSVPILFRNKSIEECD